METVSLVVKKTKPLSLVWGPYSKGWFLEWKHFPWLGVQKAEENKTLKGSVSVQYKGWFFEWAQFP